MNDAFYIWINPVVAGMYAPEVLEALLSRHNCISVHCLGDWAGDVRRKYRELAAREHRIVSDARCPMAAALVRELNRESLYVAEVDPILIHAARELASREDLLDRPKLITTPCGALAELGNSLGLENTRFVAWNVLLKQWGAQPHARKLTSSPIPPGFFDGEGLPVRKITGQENIVTYAACACVGEEKLVEMLYCKDGCHNGDGVTFDE